MARLKSGSDVLDKAMRRMAGMLSISETLNFGNGLSVAIAPVYETSTIRNSNGTKAIVN